jgi:hypothetical protein
LTNTKEIINSLFISTLNRIPIQTSYMGLVVLNTWMPDLMKCPTSCRPEKTPSDLGSHICHHYNIPS